MTLRVLLRDLAPGQDYAIQFRSNTGEATSDWSQVQRFTTTNDTIPPSQPTNLSFYDSGTAFIADWDKVTTSATTPLSPLRDFRYYRVNVTTDLGNPGFDFFSVGEHFELSKEQNIATFGSFQSSLSVRVYCVDQTFNESVPAIATVDPQAPPTPSTPTVGNYLGLLLAAWDGKGSGAVSMPSNWDHCEIHASKTSGFTPDATTLVGKFLQDDGSAKIVLAGLDRDSIYYVRLIAVNGSGRKSGPSAEASGTPTNITGLDIANGQIGVNQINFTARDIGGANAYYQTSQPVNTGQLKDGDIWYDTDNGYTTYRFDGTNWQTAPEIGVVAGTKILAGTLTADAVGTNLLITASANIANGVIDDAHIQNLDAGKITTGILQSAATNTYGGVSQPAWSFDLNGNAVINTATIYGELIAGSATNNPTQNAAAVFRSYNYVPNTSGWAIHGDGSVEFTAGTFRGQLITGTPGTRRTEVLNGGVSQVNFYNATGFKTTIEALTVTNGSGSHELIRMRAPITGVSNPYWNGYYASADEISQIQSGEIDFAYLNTLRFFIADTRENLNGKVIAQFLNTGEIDFYPYVNRNFNIFTANNGTTSTYSLLMNIFAPSNQGGGIRFAYDPGVQTSIDALVFDASAFINFRASGFPVASDQRLKANIQDKDVPFLDDVLNMKVKKYQRTDFKGNVLKHPDGQARNPEYGFLAQEVPTRVLPGATLDTTGYNSIELYALVTQLYGAFQEFVTESRGDIMKLKNGNGKP